MKLASVVPFDSMIPPTTKQLSLRAFLCVFSCISDFASSAFTVVRFSLLLPSHTMLPTSSTRHRPPPVFRHNSLFMHYLGRIVKWRQMDIEYTFWQMLYLCTSPKVVYQQTKYHKQTKNQWARDDPAFVVVCTVLLMIAASAYSSAYAKNALSACLTIVSVVLFHFLLMGFFLATIFWLFSNHYLRGEPDVNSYAVEQHVEWLYAFDVHCNAYFPLFVSLYVMQYFLSPLLIGQGILPVIFSNLLFMLAFSHYHYLNFLGYNVLPFLEKGTVLLLPILMLVFIFPFSILAGFNPTKFVLSFYFG